MPKGGKVIGALRTLFEGQGSIAGNDSDLEYGVSRGANGKHYVRFNARVQTGENAYLAGGAFGEEPTNSKQNLTVVRAPTRRAAGSVKLYLPAQISVSQKSNFGEPEMGAIVAGVSSAMKSVADGSGVVDSVVAAAKDNAGQSLGEAVGRGVGAMAEGMGATGADSIANIKTGRTKNNNTELMFEGVDRRSFSFTFRLLPHNAVEADVIQQIVKSFRFHMAPHIPNGADFGRTLVAPSTYNITYSHQAELHKISECVLESVDVKYGGERPQFFHNNRPTETELTLQFKELEIITKRRIEEGY